VTKKHWSSRSQGEGARQIYRPYHQESKLCLLQGSDMWDPVRGISESKKEFKRAGRSLRETFKHENSPS